MANTGQRTRAADGQPGTNDDVSAATLPRSAATARRRVLLAGVALAVSVSVLGLLALGAGWEQSVRVLERARWQLLWAVIASHLLAYMGYLLAHHRFLNLCSERSLRWRETTIVLVVGFGALPVQGGFGVDRAALLGLGIDREEAAISSLTLAVIELAILAPAAWVCSLLLIGTHGVQASESLPWAILVPLLAAPVLVCTARATRRRSTPQARRPRVRRALAAIAQTLELARHPLQSRSVVLGIGLYWAADIGALALALRLCHVHLGLSRLILAYATGYLLTRRALPLAGAGASEVLLCLSLASVGVALHVAVPAVLIYRVTDLALTLLPALASNPAFIRLARLKPYTPAEGIGRNGAGVAQK